MSNKLGLLIGINYFNTAHELNGCINDTKNIENYLINKLKYNKNNITILTDHSNTPNNLKPTKNNIINALKNTINKIKNENINELFLFYSGHGSNIYDTSNDERDGMDEVIIPIDYYQGNIIKDDTFNLLINTIPDTCKVFALFDCCNSGTIIDLKYLLVSKTKNTIENSKSIVTNPNVYLISGCRDDQTSADYFNSRTNEFAGALTTSFLQTVKMYNYNNIPFINLIINMNNYLKRNNFTQRPQVSSNRKVDKNSYYIKNNSFLVQYSPLPRVQQQQKPPNRRRRFRNRKEYIAYVRYLYYLRMRNSGRRNSGRRNSGRRRNKNINLLL